MKSLMEYKGFKAQIMEAERLTGDYTHELPPGNPIEVFHSEEFAKYPEQWMKGPGVFVVPVRPNKGLWFDWTQNSKKNTAIVPTVKGCNPITGLQTSGIRLERYDTKCPKHGIEFKGDRFCSECGYKWPTQNYISYPNTLWLDTWNSGDGVSRQFFFTEDEMRDVATHLIGKDQIVPAFGFAFFRPKETRPEDPETTRSFNYTLTTINNNPPFWGQLYYQPQTPNWFYNTHYLNEVKTTCDSLYNDGHAIYACNASSAAPSEKFTKGLLDSDEEIHVKSFRSAPVKEVSIGAGAKINQNVILDPYPLESWKDTADASMVIYFVFQEKLEELKAGGMIDLVGKKEGMLEGIPVG